MKRRLLIVDDDDGMVGALQAICDTVGFEIIVATNGAAALDLLKREKIDLVITDVRMPVMGGMMLLDELRQLDHQVPVILMSGYYDFTIDEVHNRSGVMLIDKPFTKQQIVEIVQFYSEPVPKAG